MWVNVYTDCEKSKIELFFEIYIRRWDYIYECTNIIRMHIFLTAYIIRILFLIGMVLCIFLMAFS